MAVNSVELSSLEFGGMDAVLDDARAAGAARLPSTRYLDLLLAAHLRVRVCSCGSHDTTDSRCRRHTASDGSRDLHQFHKVGSVCRPSSPGEASSCSPQGQYV